MEYTKIEGYVVDLLTVSAVDKVGEEAVWDTLHDLLMAVARFELMTDEEKRLTETMCKRLRYFFATNFTLKERKERKEKKNFPPNPLIKEKQSRDKAENKRERVCDAVSGFDDDLKKRREAFRQQCMAYANEFDNKRLADFFRHYSQESQTTGKMMFEAEEYWNLDSRVRLWMNNRHTAEIKAASTRQKKQQKTSNEEQRSKELAEERRRANEERERQREEDKACAVTHEEWQAMKAAVEREQNGACSNYVERKQARCETSNNENRI